MVGARRDNCMGTADEGLRALRCGTVRRRRQSVA